MDDGRVVGRRLNFLRFLGNWGFSAFEGGFFRLMGLFLALAGNVSRAIGGSGTGGPPA
jgi:hypothetical protein